MKHLVFLFAVLIGLGSCNSEKSPEEGQEPEGPTQWLTFTGPSSNGKKVVLVSGDEEYRSEEAMPQMAKILAKQHGFDCTVLFAQDPNKLGYINPDYTGNIPGLEAIDDADLVILMTRFRNLPVEQMEHFERYLMEGKPIIGLRTATHAFNFKDTTHKYQHWGNQYRKEGDPWDGGFGRLVLGEKWYTHHGHHKHQSTRGLIAPGSEDHPILNGIADGEIWGPTDVYGVRLPLPGDARPLVMGQVVNRVGEFDENDPFFGMRPTDTEAATENPAAKNPYNPNDPMMPVAWTKSYELPGGKTGKAFTCTTAAAIDMVNEGVRRLLVNATFYLTGLEVPEKASVDVEGTYEPSTYSFSKEGYWENKGLQVTDMQ